MSTISMFSGACALYSCAGDLGITTFKGVAQYNVELISTNVEKTNGIVIEIGEFRQKIHEV